jgi:hypothetical protein
LHLYRCHSSMHRLLTSRSQAHSPPMPSLLHISSVFLESGHSGGMTRVLESLSDQTQGGPCQLVSAIPGPACRPLESATPPTRCTYATPGRVPPTQPGAIVRLSDARHGLVRHGRFSVTHATEPYLRLRPPSGCNSKFVTSASGPNSQAG